MKRFVFQHWVVCVFFSSFTSFASQAAEEGLSIPKINGQPTLADFAGMQANTSLARSMNKAENFVQREPYPGDPSAQRTEASVSYTHLTLPTILLV